MASLPVPYVAFFQGPDGRNDRFQVQGMIDREAIGCAVEALIDLLDAIDGDPDLENASDLEDDFGLTAFAADGIGPGCNISDPDFGVDDEGEGIDEREEDWGDYDYPIPISGGGSGDH